MRRALAAIAFGLCLVGLLRHRLRRAHPLGAFRCETCGRTFADLDEAGEKGSGYVRPARPLFSRDGAGGRSETSRSGDFVA